MAAAKKTPPHTRASGAAHPAVLSARELNRATLDRQLLLRRSTLTAERAVAHLVGLQAQNTRPPYFQLFARLAGFAPSDLSALMESRAVVRTVTLRSTLHTHTAEDALTLRPLVQPARERELHLFRKGLVGVDTARLARIAQELVEERPRTVRELRQALLEEWPGADPLALTVAARCLLPLVQVTPRGLWDRSGQVALTTAGHWLGRTAPAPLSPDALVLRYLAAFGPASVRDLQTWAGLTMMREVFDRLRPRLLTFRDENGTELFDLPDAPRPGPDVPAPPRFLPEFDNVLLGHADRTRVIPAVHHGRNGKGNQAYGTVLVDGFLAAVWRLERGKGRGGAAVVTVQPFEPLRPADRDAVTAEAAHLLDVMTDADEHDVRFGHVVDFDG
ncbi:winged helix DNA-binding domain-containing protein [uncultured Streptomyces sp.]|uniref:winged helix DNA-binding domain-containing protein n=1 Tax=uncultured Streptomyces sp. TaxID=174707 RepID=UPI002614FCFE|nr:winged helix DNA-binding domain-containing protein [uncultured Streptomyces sp.]